MAIALANDVSEHFNGRGSPVFICSLDAQGAFDHIPHSVIFSKLDGVLPDHIWRLLYRWYSAMYVTVRLNGSLGRRLRVERGVKTGFHHLTVTMDVQPGIPGTSTACE